MPSKRSFPTAVTVIAIVIVLAALASWIIPAGRYYHLSVAEDHFELETPQGLVSLHLSQSVLDSLGVKARVEKFTKGDIRKPVAIPGSFHRVEKSPQGIIQVLEAPFRGIYDTVDIIFFVLIIGSFISVFTESGALEKGIRHLVQKMKGREQSLIVVFSLLFAAGGASYGMGEEALAFYPVLVPVFLAAGYDLLIPVAILFLAPQVGTLASVSNPFSVIMASNVSGVRWTQGLEGRLFLFASSMLITIVYLLRYGKKIRKDPGSSLVLRLEGAVQSRFPVVQNDVLENLDHRSKLILVLFVLTFLLMISGVVFLGWWLLEMSVVFLASSIILAAILRMKEKIFVNNLIRGAEGLLGVAFIIGLARGVTVILNEGNVSDSILFYGSGIVQHLPAPLFIVLVFILFLFLTLFISSNSGMAVLTMPIMGSLGGMAGVGAEHVVDAYLLGMGVMGIITPTGLAMPSLAMVNISYRTWMRFMLPLMGWLFLLAILYLLVTVVF